MKLTENIEYQSIFISYSFKDKQFAKNLFDQLKLKNIETFLWEYDAIGGETLPNIMSNNIKNKDRILFIASANSIKSKACQFELSQGRKKQAESWKNVLFPIHIDNFLFEVKKDDIRPKEFQDEYWENIEELKNLNSLDFCEFKEKELSSNNSFDLLFHKLLMGLRK